MERFITDTIYNNRKKEDTPTLETKQKRLYSELSTLLTGEDYIRIEEELNGIYSELEKKAFYLGFIEGIRFLIGCMN